MWPAVLALLSSATFGAADFLGGMATRRGSTVAVVVSSQTAGLLIVLAALPFLPHSFLTPRDALWGCAAGLAGGAGVGLLYYGLATAPMTIVAPVTAVAAVVVPVGVGLALGEKLSAPTSAGIVLAGVAIGLVSQSGSGAAHVTRETAIRALRLALPAGLVVGLFLVALQRTPATAGLWPLVAARFVSISLFAIAALIVRQPVLMPRPAVVTAVAGGSLDMIANVLYLLAVRQGQLSVIATLASLYPASTVLLARFVLGERVTARQAIGIAGAFAAIVLIVTGSVR
jgi:drug/metabolite transporter (DMT)-like permease